MIRGVRTHRFWLIKLTARSPYHYPLIQLQRNMAEISDRSKVPVSAKGEFVRRESSFRRWITKDGSSGFPAASGRYHLYVSLACPWAHRTIITRKLKGLEDVISLNVVDHYMGEKGWRFDPEVAGATADTVNGFGYIREVYFLADKDYQGRFTVPVLWDKEKKTVVNNESSEIIRMLNTEFNEFCKTEEQRAINIYPEHLRKEIDSVNEWIYKYLHFLGGVECHYSLIFSQGHQQWCVQGWFCHCTGGV